MAGKIIGITLNIGLTEELRRSFGQLVLVGILSFSRMILTDHGPQNPAHRFNLLEGW
jgi:hypothetical protein